MYDKNLMFWDGVAITTTTTGTLAINKTRGAGVWLEAAVTSAAGSTTGRTLDIVISESDDDSSYNNLVTFPQLTDVGRRNRLVQTQKKYLKATATVGAGTGFNLKLYLGVVTGPVPDEVA